MKSILTFNEDGTITGLKTAMVPLEKLGDVTSRRVSHILPCNFPKRLAFRALRLTCGERGLVAEWARHWRGPWQVRWANSPRRIAFTHPSRRVCVDWEIDQILSRNVSEMERILARQ